MAKNTILEELIKKLTRRIDTVQTSVDQVLQDRNILEDLVLRVAELENAMHMNRETQMDVQTEMKKDIKSVQFAVEDKVDEVKKEIDDKKIVVEQGKFDKLKKVFKK